jgi:putative SOS response-associated peptidase YedK
MCGRFGLSRPEKLDPKRFGVSQLPLLEARYNIAPSAEVLVVRLRKDERVADMVKWGLIPWWAKDPSIGQRMANARADTAFEKPAFRDAMKARRCLIPADVFYEWQAIPGQKRKQPHAVQMASEEPFAIGGLWEYWRPKDGDGDGIVSCTILTTEPNTMLSRIHDRMPVIIPPERYKAWLDPTTPAPALHELLRPYPSDEMEEWEVSLLVNDAKVDDERVIERVEM